MENLFERVNKNRRPMNVNRLIALAFAGIILFGALLLCLPFSSRSGTSCGFRTALFTATSSTCVTGLILADTWTQWSGFGQTVIITLIEIGGLGFMSIASFVIFAFKKKMNINQRLAMAQSIGVSDMGDAVRMQKRMLLGCLIVEGSGALILTARFIPKYGFWVALKLGFFHSISAFCNAGFDILGFETPGQSLIPYGTDPIVIITLSLLVIIGGLGYIVWDETVRIHSPKKWSVYTKLVLISTGSLLILGAVGIYITEWNNPETLGELSTPGKFIAGFFQSVTARTAGFDGLNQGGMTEAGKAVTMFLMLIGGSSGSTAGGLKTVTFIVLILFMWSRLRDRDEINVFNRSIPSKLVLNALTIFGIMVTMSFLGAAFICATSPVTFTDALYEAVSAIATVGLTTGITPSLSIPAQFLLIIYMYFGRVGILTISFGFLQKKPSELKYKYAETSLLIG